ncbi:hypothetical protein Cni_G17894 [Canna indica]|uniref:Phytocyanin domain-containing protein n=1 Tax=Canna indica TaxID=4628 RepID=A0AAQ3QDX6_9LILI|nr:hypothetical protein Cni_G17894 [Canna indica]
MASTSSALCLLVMTASLISSLSGAASLYKVGDAEGWRLPDPNNPDMYATWADKYAFRVGDSIMFEYKNDTVVRVSKAGYYHCNETGGGGSSSTPKDGSTVFGLDKSGFYYFVSANVDHCKKGQRLMVEAMDAVRPPSPVADGGSPAPSPTPNSTVSLTFASVLDLAGLAALLMLAFHCSCMPYDS